MVAELVYSLAFCKSKLFYECLIDDGMMECMYIAGLPPPPDISATKLNAWSVKVICWNIFTWLHDSS